MKRNRCAIRLGERCLFNGKTVGLGYSYYVSVGGCSSALEKLRRIYGSHSEAKKQLPKWRDEWPSSTLPYRLRVVPRAPRAVHPSTLGLRCTGSHVRCEYTEQTADKCVMKCGWFGHESSRPYERPRCCRFGVSEIPRMEDGKATSK